MTDFRFATATCTINPPFPCAMHGYFVRRDNYDGVNDPLTFTALILESGDQRALIGAADICTFPNDGRTHDWLKRLGKMVGCPADNVMLNASHTHGGPMMPSGGMIWAERAPMQETAGRYADWLYEQIAHTVQHALAHMIEGSLELVEGKTRFPMNRRPTRPDGSVPNAPNPDGEIDDQLQLLVCRDTHNRIRAVAQRLSCHPVATGPQHRLTADYVGGWRTAFAEAFGDDVTPIFLQGAGGDMRPHHVADGDKWRFATHDELPGMGRDLLHETIAALIDGKVTPIDNLTLRGSLREVHAPCEPTYTTRAKVQPLLEHDNQFLRRFGQWCLDRLTDGKDIPQTADYHAQTLWLNDEVALVGLDVEPLIGLGRCIEEAFAPRRAVVLGYINGCVSYAPDTVELKRGGYEAESYMFDGWSGPWIEGLEKSFIPRLALDPASLKT